MKQSPCMYCTDERHIGCHGTCERYINWKASKEDEKKRRVKEAMEIDFTVDSIMRKMKKKGRKAI